MDEQAVPLPSTKLLSKLNGLPILTSSVPTVATLTFTRTRQIICGWGQDPTTPLQTVVAQRYLDRSFKLIDALDGEGEWSLLRIDYKDELQLVVIPDRESNVYFCTVVQLRQV